MAIEKWRPAKAGDVGIVRVRQYEDSNWFVLLNAKIDSLEIAGVQVNKSGWWRYCEVLVAYLDDTEVEALEDKIDTWHGTFRKTESLEQVIRKHFERGE